jgi:hypothetical protein
MQKDNYKVIDELREATKAEMTEEHKKLAKMSTQYKNSKEGQAMNLLQDELEELAK